MRLYSAQAYASWGSPKPGSSAIGDCGPSSSMHPNCPAGAPMPLKLKSGTTLCPGATGDATCDNLSADPTKCCACRKTKATGPVAAYASVAASTAYSSAPDCSKQLASLPANTKVAYTGAKLLAYTNANKGCTVKRDYAQVVVQVGNMNPRGECKLTSCRMLPELPCSCKTKCLALPVWLRCIACEHRRQCQML